MNIKDEIMEAAKRIRDTAMEQTMYARIPEIGHFGAIAQDADWLVDHLTACQQEVERLRAASIASGNALYLAKPSVEERLVAKVGSERAYELAISGKSLEELAAIADAPEPEQSNEA